MRKEVKTTIEGLRIGMFVSRLDRPWIQTPFILEGVMIKNDRELKALRKCCEYAYVDVERGLSPDPRYWLLNDTTATRSQPRHGAGSRLRAYDRNIAISNEYTQLRKQTYEDSSRFRAESNVAATVSNKLESGYQRFLDDFKRGRKLDLAVVREGVSVMVESIVRNPSAMMWVTQIKKLDEYTYSRALGTSVWCATFGRHLGLEKADIEQLALGGLLLDIGKSRVPLELLKKSAKLSKREMALMRSHVKKGVELLSEVSDKTQTWKLPISAFQMVATHHERADGSGYPQGLNNDQIPIFGRIAGIVDTYDAITSERPYRCDEPPKSPHQAIAELYDLRGTAFQPELVEQFIQAVGLYPSGSLVELSTGEVGVVVATNGLRRLRPTIMLLLDKNKKPLDDFKHLDLSHPDVTTTVVRGLQTGAYGIDMKEFFL